MELGTWVWDGKGEAPGLGVCVCVCVCVPVGVTQFLLPKAQVWEPGMVVTLPSLIWAGLTFLLGKE